MTKTGMKSWTVRYTDDQTGNPAQLVPMTEAEARFYLDIVTDQIDREGVLVDLLDEVRDRLPVGAAVTHKTRRDLRGRIVEVDARTVPHVAGRAEPGMMIAHSVDSGGCVTVYVEWEGKGSSWYVATWIEALADVTLPDIPAVR